MKLILAASQLTANLAHISPSARGQCCSSSVNLRKILDEFTADTNKPQRKSFELRFLRKEIVRPMMLGTTTVACQGISIVQQSRRFGQGAQKSRQHHPFPELLLMYSHRASQIFQRRRPHQICLPLTDVFQASSQIQMNSQSRSQRAFIAWNTTRKIKHFLPMSCNDMFRFNLPAANDSQFS